MAILDGDEESFAQIVEEAEALESPERREVLRHLLVRSRRDVKRQSLKNALRQKMEKPEMAWDCVATLREAWLFLRRAESEEPNEAEEQEGKTDLGVERSLLEDDGDDEGDDADLRQWMIAAEVALMGGGAEGNEGRRIEQDAFMNLAMEAKINAVKIRIHRQKEEQKGGEAGAEEENQVEEEEEEYEEELAAMKENTMVVGTSAKSKTKTMTKTTKTMKSTKISKSKTAAKTTTATSVPKTVSKKEKTQGG